MAGAVRGGLRPHHPTKHSFIVVGLVVVVIVLGINYWSISSKNTRLALELAKVHKNYKVVRSYKSLFSKLDVLKLLWWCQMCVEVHRAILKITPAQEQ